MKRRLRFVVAAAAGLAVLGGGIATAVPAVAGTAAASAGCSNGRSAIPAGASTRRIPDFDGDGRADTEFLTAKKPYRYGIKTAAGGVYTIDDVLAGPGRHRAWAVATDGQGRLIVIDDGVDATVQQFRDCRIVRQVDRDGQPFLMGMTGSGGPNTGVACNDQNGGILVEASRAVRRAGGRYDVVWTTVQPVVGTEDPDDVMLDTRSDTRWRNLAATSLRVQQARTSHCWAAPETVQVVR